jgi:hypothetical protein
VVVCRGDGAGRVEKLCDVTVAAASARPQNRGRPAPSA